jgi:hypothetical protein
VEEAAMPEVWRWQLAIATSACIAAAPAAADTLTFVDRGVVCPVGGETFTARLPALESPSHQQLDLKQLGAIASPWPLARCPGNGFVIYKDSFSGEELARLAAYVASAEYQAMRAAETDYFLAAALRRHVGDEPAALAMTLLQATWEAAPGEQYRRYAAAALAAFERALAGDGRWSSERVIQQLIAGELERRLGRFEAARQRFETVAAVPPAGTGAVAGVVQRQLRLVAERDAGVHLVPRAGETP